MKEKKLYKIAFMGDKDHGCDIISTLESWGGSNYYPRTGSDPEYVYFINDLGTIDFIHNSEMLSEEMKNFYFLFWHDYNSECHLKVGESINYGGQDYDVDSILFDANNRCIVYKLKSFGIGVEYITNNELTPTEEYQTEEENNEYLCKNNMKRKLAIRGHATRGKEVIELLGMLGAKNNCASTGYNLGLCYLIDDEFDICAHYFGYDDYEDGGLNIFTLEEFLEKYPYKVGDKVIDIADGDSGIITAMKWDEDISDMKYRIAFDNGDMGWFTIDTFEFLKKDKNLEKEKNMKKKLAIKGHPTRGKEVIELLEMLGGKNIYNFSGFDDYAYYVIEGCQNEIRAGEYLFGDEDMHLFTLEEFLEKYPFKVGDKVHIYVQNDDIDGRYDIETAEITSMRWNHARCKIAYKMKDINREFYKEEIKCKVVDSNKSTRVMEEKDKAKAPDIKGEDYSGKRFGYKIPDGYEFDVVVDGKIFLKPIKPKYPTTYEDCCKVLGISYRAQLSYTNPDVERGNIYLTKEKHLLDAFMKLRICRNAYWKIAGEQMGLGKPWEPDWTNLNQLKYCIMVDVGEFITTSKIRGQQILTFPTKDMQDAFYENFKDLIEQCKELL